MFQSHVFSLNRSSTDTMYYSPKPEDTIHMFMNTNNILQSVDTRPFHTNYSWENSHEVFSNVNIQILFNHSKLWFQSHLLQTTFIVATSTKTVFQTQGTKSCLP